MCDVGVVGVMNIRECKLCGDYVCLEKCWPTQSESTCHKCMLEAMKEAGENDALTPNNEEEAPGSPKKPAADDEVAPESPTKRLRSSSSVASSE